MAVWYIISDYVLEMKACPVCGNCWLAVWYIISDYVLVMKACPTVGCVVYNK